MAYRKLSSGMDELRGDSRGRLGRALIDESLLNRLPNVN
jgi:hypothetical protein